MRSSIRPFALVGTLVIAASLAACGNQRVAPAPQYSGGYQTAPNYQSQPMNTEYGRVSNIEMLQGNGRQGQTSGAGALLGAVVGGVLGSQVGGGSGRTAAAVLGVVGGAVAGNAIEGNNNRNEVQGEGYRISIQLDQGGMRFYDVSTPGDLRTGDRVRLYNGQISRL